MDSHKIKFIAEIGLNHLGNEEKAMRMVECCLKTEVDAVTFQIKTDDYYNNNRPFRCRLSQSFYVKMIELIHNSGKEVGIALAESSHVQKWSDSGIDFWKVLSMDFNNQSLIRDMKSTGREIYISTGVSSVDEIQNLHHVFPDAWLIHTTLTKNSKDANLSAIKTMRTLFGDRVGYGVHCSDPETVYYALAYGAAFVFLYVREDDDEYYPDYEHSVTTNELGMWIKKWRSSFEWIGTGVKNKKSLPGWVLQ